MPTLYSSREPGYDLHKAAAMLAGNRKSPECQQYFIDLTQYFIDEHPERIQSQILCGPGTCTVTRGGLRTYCAERDIPIPRDLEGPETLEEVAAMLRRMKAGASVEPRAESSAHLAGQRRVGNRAGDVMALICLALETLGIDATRDNVIRFLRPIVGHPYSAITKEISKGFLVEEIKEDGGVTEKPLTLRRLSKKISDIRAKVRSDRNYLTDRAARVSKALREILTTQSGNCPASFRPTPLS